MGKKTVVSVLERCTGVFARHRILHDGVNRHFHGDSIVLGVSPLEITERVQGLWCRCCFVEEFGVSRGSWDQSPAETEGPLRL